MDHVLSYLTYDACLFALASLSAAPIPTSTPCMALCGIWVAPSASMILSSLVALHLYLSKYLATCRLSASVAALPGLPGFPRTGSRPVLRYSACSCLTRLPVTPTSPPTFSGSSPASILRMA